MITSEMNKLTAAIRRRNNWTWGRAFRCAMIFVKYTGTTTTDYKELMLRAAVTFSRPFGEKNHRALADHYWALYKIYLKLGDRRSYAFYFAANQLYVALDRGEALSFEHLSTEVVWGGRYSGKGWGDSMLAEFFDYYTSAMSQKKQTDRMATLLALSTPDVPIDLPKWEETK